ncbi:uncharacterized protein LOC128501425 [Spea bombifrons]|uniref:uncharacterized protein LOC128501425 n=1 Tax=Spea bombifrons TaxID=233779 RepID=UPI00234BEC45|nr:uncharacterized protein LOC128501425 [Spea bombifrons]
MRSGGKTARMSKMSLEQKMALSGVGYTILALGGLSFVAFLLYCVSCCHRKAALSVTHRPAPRSPETSPRYESGPFPSAANQQIPERHDEESDEDFEDVFPQFHGAASAARTQNPSSACGRNSTKQDISMPDTNSQDTYINLSQDYVNVNVSTNAPARKEHTYLEVIPSEDDVNETEVTTAGDAPGEAPRGSLDSCAEKSLPFSHCSSYENITTCRSPPFGDSNPDYVNVIT